MTLIADASGDLSATWPWWVWAAGVATILGGWLFVLTRVLTRNLDTDEPDITVDVAPCVMRCGCAGTVSQVERADLGGRLVLVCPGHSDEGQRKGWWAS